MPDRAPGTLETDAAAVRQARTLLACARHGALAVNLPATGYPGASRVTVATDFDATPLILVSSLAWHTRALLDDRRCSLLLGEPGRGDPLAHPRITLFAEARPLARDSQDHARARRRFLARHPKAALYADFGDFLFVRLLPQRASLNGGFGKAYELAAADLAPRGDYRGVAAVEAEALAWIERMRAPGEEGSAWCAFALDSEGVDLARDGSLRRVWFDPPLATAAGLRPALQRALGGSTG